MPYHSVCSKIISSSCKLEICYLYYDAKNLLHPQIIYELIYNLEYSFSNNNNNNI